MSAMAATNTLVVFDFDCTIIDVDSDPWVVEKLGAMELMNSLKTYLPWNEMMDTMMSALHSQGKSIADVKEALETAPLQPEKISAIMAAFQLGAELRVVSDANDFFIKAILDYHKLTPCITEVHTNPSTIDEQGCVHIFPFHPKSEPPHGCSLCPPNMCKGRILESIKAAWPENEKKRIIYVGDGCGDLCPSLGLDSCDYVLPREGYPLEALLQEHSATVKAQVLGWKNAKHLEDILLNLLEPMNTKLVENTLPNLLEPKNTELMEDTLLNFLEPKNTKLVKVLVEDA